MNYRSSKRAKALAISDATRRHVFARDGGRCVYCRRVGNPEAHFVPRSKGGLGIPENILTLCRPCHNRFDNGTKMERDGMREFFREYLMSKYPDWDETKLYYNKYEETEEDDFLIKEEI